MDNYFDFFSFVVYIAVFSSSLLFVALSEERLFTPDGEITRGQMRVKAIILLIIAIVIPCLFAAFRGLNVGRDISTYIINNYMFGQEKDMSFSYYLNNMPVPVEPLFALLLFYFSKISSLRCFFFTVEALIIAPLAIVMVKSRKKGSLVLEFALFYLLFYNFSLSGMRQSIAMSFLLLSLLEAREVKIIRAIAAFIIAYLFHTSVVLIIAIILAFYVINKAKHRTVLLSMSWIALIATLGIFSQYAERIAFFVGKVNPRYSYYIIKYLHSGYSFNDLPTTDIVLKTALVLIIVSVTLWNRIISRDDRLMGQLVLLGRFFVVFNGVFYESMRIAYYFDYFIPVYASDALQLIRINSNKIIYKSVIIGLAFLYWSYFIMYLGGYTTNVVTFNI